MNLEELCLLGCYLAPGSSETSVLTRATWRNNPEDTILHSHRHENVKSPMNLHCNSSNNKIMLWHGYLLIISRYSIFRQKLITVWKYVFSNCIQ
jgi:hypothetical protein